MVGYTKAHLERTLSRYELLSVLGFWLLFSEYV